MWEAGKKLLAVELDEKRDLIAAAAEKEEGVLLSCWRRSNRGC